MGIHLRRPSDDDLTRLLDRTRSDELTYGPTGTTIDGGCPDGLRRHEWSTTLPGGSFDRARDALSTWAMHRATGLHVAAEGDVATGINVAMAAPLPAGWIDVTCRVVKTLDEPGRWGFAYGTLPVHPERGEESFVLTLDCDGRVRFDVVAVSAPTHPLARLAGPVADRMQDRAVRGYLRALEAIATGKP